VQDHWNMWTEERSRILISIGHGKIKGDINFFSSFLIERYRWRSISLWLRFFDQTLFSHSVLFNITCTSVTGEIMMNTRQL